MNRKNSDKPNQYPEFDQLNLPTIEKEILKWWEDNKIFEQSISTRPDDKCFVFYEGPPSANGKPGIHHVMSRTIKDLFCRYKTLQGYRVERKVQQVGDPCGTFTYTSTGAKGVTGSMAATDCW